MAKSSPEHLKAVFRRTILENPYIPVIAPEFVTCRKCRAQLPGRGVTMCPACGKNNDGMPSRRQTRFLAYDGREAMYGGSAGGGKSAALLMAALQYVEVPGYAALILRRTRPMLVAADGMVTKSLEWARECDWKGKGAAYNQTRMEWTFPSGATLTFAYLDHDKHLDNFQGGAWAFCGFDEAAQFPEQRYRYLFSRLRKPTDSPVPVRMRAASNPGGPGHDWIKKRFITGDRPQFFVPAKLADNPGLAADEYIRSLVNLDPIRRAQLLAGDWDAYAGGRFKEAWFRYFFVQEDHAGVLRYWMGEDDDQGVPVEACWNAVICDPACTEKDVDEAGDADPTAIGVFAITPKHDLLVLHVTRAWLDIDDIPKRIAALSAQFSPMWVGIEDNGFAIGITRACQRLGLTVKSLSPEGKGKLVRVTPAIIRTENGQLYLPEKGTLPWTGKDKWCEEFISELVQFTGIEGMDAHDDQCVAAGTLIVTDQGERKIEDMRAGDMVLTRNGYRRVLAAAMTNPKARIWELQTDRSVLYATTNHPVLTEGGFVRLDALEYTDNVMVCVKPSPTMAESTIAIPKQSDGITGFTSSAMTAVSAARACSIGIFGRICTDLSRRGTTFITSMKTLSITLLKTWNASRSRNIGGGTARPTNRPNSLLTWLESAHKLLCGTNPKKGEPGTEFTASWLGPDGKAWKGHASDASSPIGPAPIGTTYDSVQTLAKPHFAAIQALTTNSGSARFAKLTSSSTNTPQKRVAPARVVLLTDTGRSGPVYNLTVETDNEYFANGILCHNCDILAYMVQQLERFGTGGPTLVQPQADTLDEREMAAIAWLRDDETAGGLVGWER